MACRDRLPPAFKRSVAEHIVLEQIRQNRQTSLWLFDGYDEASPELQAIVIRLLQEEDLTVILTHDPE